MSYEKLTEDLRSQLAQQPDEELLEIVVELGHDAVAPMSMPEMKRTFTERAQPIQSAIVDLGGEVTEEAWINSTLRARVPAGCLRGLSRIDAVTAVDVPHRIVPD